MKTDVELIAKYEYDTETGELMRTLSSIDSGIRGRLIRCAACRFYKVCDSFCQKHNCQADPNHFCAWAIPRLIDL